MHRSDGYRDVRRTVTLEAQVDEVRESADASGAPAGIQVRNGSNARARERGACHVGCRHRRSHRHDGDAPGSPLDQGTAGGLQATRLLRSHGCSPCRRRISRACAEITVSVPSPGSTRFARFLPGSPETSATAPAPPVAGKPPSRTDARTIVPSPVP
ncbi:hypothetical protein [Ornithinimicrobium kibberense]|uniref:hypothetical protein n=1 Tax=Ornithinimicrobium kibberense TaxID=282060 RepID=UPI00361F31F9